jgi:arsenite methyltransferase
MNDDTQAEEIRKTVRSEYAKIARQGRSSCCPSSCCSDAASTPYVSESCYDRADLDNLPDGADMGLSCGNPTALAMLQYGETVLDLGAGGGFDVFIAGRKVGPEGRAIGVDMTPDMVDRARLNTATYREKSGLDNVEFRLGEIEHLPVEDASIDVVISNCVINLSPDKDQVWREIARVLKPGGRVSVSDIALIRPLPDRIRESAEALVSCIAGAVLLDDSRRMIGEAGLQEMAFDQNPEVIDSIASSDDSLCQEISECLPPDTMVSDFVTSVSITATKPVPDGG